MEPLLEGIALLIVDANMILALDVEDTLTRRGAARVDVVGTAEEALLILRSARYDLALVDVNLPQEGALPIAVALSTHGIPFAFSASHGEKAELPMAYNAIQLIHMPCNEAYLVGAIARLLEQSPRA